MANYNKNDRNKGGYFDQYVNFDQFLMQHNINNWSPLRGQQSYGFQSPSTYNSNTPFHQQNPSNGSFHFQSNAESPTGGGFRPPQDWLQNSNLTATASEFVPQMAQNTANSSTLLATASEFVPRTQQNFDKPQPPPTTTISDNKQSNTVLCDMGKNDRIATKVTDEHASKTDSVIEALSNTHISDGNNIESKPLNSSGGAIKKVRSQDYRNDSRDRHSNGKCFAYKHLKKMELNILFIIFNRKLIYQ